MSTGKSSGTSTSSKLSAVLRGNMGNALTAIQRYVSNNFTDATKQSGLDLFLGAHVPTRGSVVATPARVRARACANGGVLVPLPRALGTRLRGQKCQRRSCPTACLPPSPTPTLPEKPPARTT